MKFKVMILLNFYLLLGFYGPTEAADLIASLTVSGERLAIPEWQDENSLTITSMTFDFSGIADGNANVNVLSDEHQFKLNDSNDPGGLKPLKLIRPKNCSIGAATIVNSHVRFVINGTIYGNSNISITEGILQTAQMRFNKAGNYGDKSGVVSCATAGRITFLY